MKARKQIEDFLWNKLIQAVATAKNNQVKPMLMREIKQHLREPADTRLEDHVYWIIAKG